MNTLERQVALESHYREHPTETPANNADLVETAAFFNAHPGLKRLTPGVDGFLQPVYSTEKEVPDKQST